MLCNKQFTTLSRCEIWSHFTLTHVISLIYNTVYIYIYVQKNAWHPPEGKCHVLRMCHGTRALVPRSQTPYLKVAFWVKDLAMR